MSWWCWLAVLYFVFTVKARCTIWNTQNFILFVMNYYTMFQISLQSHTHVLFVGKVFYFFCVVMSFLFNFLVLVVYEFFFALSRLSKSWTQMIMPTFWRSRIGILLITGLISYTRLVRFPILFFVFKLDPLSSRLLFCTCRWIWTTHSRPPPVSLWPPAPVISWYL